MATPSMKLPLPPRPCTAVWLACCLVSKEAPALRVAWSFSAKSRAFAKNALPRPAVSKPILLLCLYFETAHGVGIGHRYPA